MAEPAATLKDLDGSIKDLETALAPLLATPFEQLLAEAESDPVQRAKLQVLLGYVVHDLIWISLKTSGIETSTHPVMQEIERLKGYFDKLKQAAAPPTTRNKLDTAAASRFIKHAIGTQPPTYAEAPKPKGKHIRYDHDDKVDAVGAS